MKTYKIENFKIKKSCKSAFDSQPENEKKIENIKVYIIENKNDSLTISAKHEYTINGEKYESTFTSYKIKEDKKGKFISYNMGFMFVTTKIYL